MPPSTLSPPPATAPSSASLAPPHTDWNGAGTRLVAGEAASEDAYWAFADATRKLGFHAMLTRHRWVYTA